MTGIFTYRGNFSFSDIPQLEGKVALVTVCRLAAVLVANFVLIRCRRVVKRESVKVSRRFMMPIYKSHA